MDVRHSIDISASSPIQWRKLLEEKKDLEDEDEDEGVEMLLPGPSAPGMEKHRTRGRRWCRRLWKCFVVVLWVVLGLVAVVGWVLYWATVPGTRLAGEINGLVPNCECLIADLGS
jgi:hypothetical protein